MPRSMNVRSRERKRQKNATVDRRVTRRRMVVKMNQPWDGDQHRTRRPIGRAYHQEEAKGVVKHARTSGRFDGGGDLKSTGRQRDCKGEPKPAVRGQRGGTKGVPDRHFPGNWLAARSTPDDPVSFRVSSPHVPHAGQQLHQTTITKGQTDDDVGFIDVSGLHVDQAQHKGRQREGTQAQGRGVGQFAVLDRTVETRLEFSTEGGQTARGGVDMGEWAIAKASSGLGGRMLLVGHFAVEAGVGVGACDGGGAIVFLGAITLGIGGHVGWMFTSSAMLRLGLIVNHRPTAVEGPMLTV